MTRFISPGLASLIIQMQVFFTVGLVMVMGQPGANPRPIRWRPWCSVRHRPWRDHRAYGCLGDAAGRRLLTLVAALCWAGANLVSRAAGKVDMLGFVVWASLFAIPPLFVLSLVFEGWPAISRAVTHATPGAWVAVVWQSVGNTMFGYGAWGWLLARNPAATITPTALLVPVFGMGASAIIRWPWNPCRPGSSWRRACCLPAWWSTPGLAPDFQIAPGGRDP